MINPINPPNDQQIHHFKSTDQPIQTHHQPIPAHRSKPNSLVQPPKSKTQHRWETKRGSESGERQREEVRVRMREGENKILFLVLQLCYSAILKIEFHCNSIAKKFAILEFRILWCSGIWGCKCQILLTFGISLPQC